MRRIVGMLLRREREQPWLPPTPARPADAGDPLPNHAQRPGDAGRERVAGIGGEDGRAGGDLGTPASPAG